MKDTCESCRRLNLERKYWERLPCPSEIPSRIDFVEEYREFDPVLSLSMFFRRGTMDNADITTVEEDLKYLAFISIVTCATVSNVTRKVRCWVHRLKLRSLVRRYRIQNSSTNKFSLTLARIGVLGSGYVKTMIPRLVNSLVVTPDILEEEHFPQVLCSQQVAIFVVKPYDRTNDAIFDIIRRGYYCTQMVYQNIMNSRSALYVGDRASFVKIYSDSLVRAKFIPLDKRIEFWLDNSILAENKEDNSLFFCSDSQRQAILNVIERFGIEWSRV